MQQILILIGLRKISLKTFQLLLTATNLIARVKQVNSSILTLKTCLIKSEIMQLVKYLLKQVYTLNEIKNEGIIKQKKRTPRQKELLNLFNSLADIILTDKLLMSSKNENKNENDETLMSSKDDDDNKDNENQNENNDENNKTLMSSKDENENENENEDDDEIIRDLNDILDEIIDKSK